MYVSLLLRVFRLIVALLRTKIAISGEFRLSFILSDFNPPYKWLKFSR